MGDEKSGILGQFMDSNKLFRIPITFNKRKIIFGEYSPANDAIAILMNTKNLKYEEIAVKLVNTDNILLQAGREHERRGHMELTKLSSYWTVIAYKSINSYLIFYAMVKSIESKRKVNRDILLKWIKRLLVNEIFNLTGILEWAPIQEAIANSFVIAMKKTEYDTENIKDLDSLLEANRGESKLIEELTDQCEDLLNEFGIHNGWKLLISIAAIASSPNIDPILKPEIIKYTKRCRFKQHERNKELAEKLDRLPVERFHKMLVLTINHPEGIKKLLKDNVNPYKLAVWIAYDCGLKVEPITHMIYYLRNYFEGMNLNKTISRSSKAIYRLNDEYMRIFSEIAKEPYPSFLFVEDINSGNIFAYKGDLALKYPWLQEYLQTNILIDQFFESLNEGEDRITCFNRKLNFCQNQYKSGCKSCGFYNNLINSKKLYENIRKIICFQDFVHEIFS